MLEVNMLNFQLMINNVYIIEMFFFVYIIVNLNDMKRCFMRIDF